MFKVSYQVGSLMDLYTTLVKLAGQEPPKDRTVDGIDLSSALFQQKNIDRYIGFIKIFHISTSMGDFVT